MNRTTGAVHGQGEDQRTWWGRCWRYWAAPVFYWMDLLDNQRRPSHSKVTWSVAFLVALGLLIGIAFRMVLDGHRPTGTELAFVMGFASLTLATAGGLDGFKVWAKTRGAGSMDALADAVKADMTGTAKAWPDGQEPT